MWVMKKSKCLALLVALGCAAAARADEASSPAEMFLRRHPDFIVTASGETNIHHLCFRCEVIHTNRVFRLEAADAAAFARGRAAVARALARYPGPLVAAHVDRVFVARRLDKKMGDAWVKEAGCSGLRSLYLAQLPAYGDLFREAVFHHELCHLLMSANKKKFSREAWIRCNPEGFAYQMDSDLFTDPKPDDRYLEEGFLCSYGKSHIEEDVCTYAMWLFARPDWVLEQAARHPRVQAKLDLLLAFYAGLDPIFTPEHFRRFGPAQAAPGFLKNSNDPSGIVR